jgi:hypothetical protein
MGTIKSFTSLEQSKKLADILPLESADMYWSFGNIKFMDNDYDSNVVQHIPAWSLTALFDVLPEGYSFILTKSFNGKDYYCKLDGKPIETMADNPIDACYEMIIHLHELNLL